jgi:virginiamycin A acetyltransferase
MLEISPSARISPLADIEESTRGTRIAIGPQVRIDSFAKIKPTGGSGDVEIGEQSYLNSGTVLFSGNGIRIGRQVLIAPNCTLAATNHEFSDPGRPIVEQRFAASRGGIVIEDDVWIGANTVVLDGAILRQGVVVGASSLVGPGELESYVVYGGNPLRRIGRRG